MTGSAKGLETALNYPLFKAISNRRSRRISRGIKSLSGGSLSYRSDKDPAPLSELEEAMLIASTGVSGITMPDMPLTTEDGAPLLGTPTLKALGRASASAMSSRISFSAGC